MRGERERERERERISKMSNDWLPLVSWPIRGLVQTHQRKGGREERRTEGRGGET